MTFSRAQLGLGVWLTIAAGVPQFAFADGPPSTMTVG
jgi:hypothetical protein